MKLQTQSLSLSFVITFLAFQSNFAQIVDLKNDHDETILRVFENNQLFVYNLHHPMKPSVKFLLHGTIVEKVDKKNSTLWIMTLADNGTANFAFEQKIEQNVTEFHLLWHGGGSINEREICFYVAYNQAKWYNGYQSRNASWPMNTKKTILKQQFNYLFNTYRYSPPTNIQEHLLILEHLYVISDGFAILLDQHVPWFIRSATNGTDSMLCFSANNTKPFKTSELDPSYLDIKIRLFTSSNIRSVTDYILHKSSYLPKPKIVPDESMIKHPTWFTWELGVSRKEQIEDLSNELGFNGFNSTNKIILCWWPNGRMDELLQNDVYPEENFTSSFKKKEIEVGIQINALDFNTYTNELLQQFCIDSTTYVDFSIPNACSLFASQLTLLKNQKHIDAFAFFAYTNIENFNFNDTFVQKYPSLMTKRFIETVAQVGNTIISEYAFKSQHLPVWVRLTNYYNTPYDQLLLELIPTVLSISIAGYSFVLPYTAGGFRYGNLPTEEQYIRMIQTITFMPAMSIGVKPWLISQRALNVTKKCLQIHSDHITTIIELSKKHITDGNPIIRPLWYVAPDDPKALTIGDQYMLGDDILVAPVVKVGQIERTVYLLTGTWIDQHGKSYQGPGEFKVASPLEELPYFKRKH